MEAQLVIVLPVLGLCSSHSCEWLAIISETFLSSLVDIY